MNNRNQDHNTDAAESDLPTPPTELHIPTEEERLQVGKQQVEAGRVRLHKTVQTEHQEVPVDLAREEVEVERVDLPQGQVADDAFQEREIEVPLHREEPVVGKQVRTTEEVRLGKNVETETRTVAGDVRRTDVEIDDSDVDEYVTTPDERGRLRS